MQTCPRNSGSSSSQIQFRRRQLRARGSGATHLLQDLILIAPNRIPLFLICCSLLWLATSCSSESEEQKLRPRQLRDVPARALAFNFQADVDAPPEAAEEPKILPAIQDDFDKRHPDFALQRTIVSPDKQRALAIYNTADEPSQTYRIDLYSAEGAFIRDMTPPELAVVFQDSVIWSPDSNFIAFVGRKSLKAEPSPSPLGEPPLTLTEPGASPIPTSSVLPSFAPVRTFNTEQVYLCNRDGYDLKPLTTRDGLIYFALSWAPDNHALAALACKESEWDEREKQLKTAAGRPRVISVDGQERLLDDALAEAPPVWSLDSSKIATAFGVEIGIYDAAGKAPGQARIALRERLLSASAAFDEKSGANKKQSNPPSSKVTPEPGPTTDAIPVSFNPIVRIEWPTPERLYVETAYVSLRSELIKTFSRWHVLVLSPQAAVLGR
jgi:hypothetical protein